MKKPLTKGAEKHPDLAFTYGTTSKTFNNESGFHLLKMGVGQLEKNSSKTC